MADLPRPDGGADNPGGGDLRRAAAREPGKRAVKPRHAASLIVWRQARGEPEILMGMRHAKHKFMPSVLVFPGGRVDRADHGVKALTELRAETEALLRHRAPPSLARALGVAAIRELEEETGLLLGKRKGERLLADLAALDYLCRAVTPPSRAMRFNARFLLASAEAVRGELGGSGELEGLGWYPLSKALEARLADITRKILGEFAQWIEVPAGQRYLRPKIVYRGNDNRMSDE
ncbi:NUDIX domain-containing protein [Falsiroseomonas oryziterrae]|uniref:NUDIX domain-containing protein n=1 Tax=Falsiroseomonas oryziterrae TaxID=2911368 RepID=UPI001F22A5E9|nr:NUDIX domain-containing protein [Roseomonas sp. NPKOSM-4]